MLVSSLQAFALGLFNGKPQATACLHATNAVAYSLPLNESYSAQLKGRAKK